MRPTRSAIIAVVLGAVTLTAAAGCRARFDTLEDGTVRSDTITEIRLAGGSGDVTFTSDDTVKGVDIRRKVHYFNEAPPMDSTIKIDSGVLTLRTECGNTCDVSYDVRAPRGTQGLKISGENGSGDLKVQGAASVDVEIGSGDMTVTGATGSVRARTGSGDVTLSDIGGDATVNTGSGDVEGRDLRGARTAVEVGSGNITLHVPGTGDVTATTSSGDVEIWVPNGTSEVVAETGSGDRNVTVTPGTTNPHRIEIHTGSGDVTVRPGG